MPSFSDCVFIALFVWLFLAGPHGWDSLLGDADIGWHIRAGEWILDNHTVPTHDLFSFSKPGAPWFAWEWLSDVIFALLFRMSGFKGVVLLAGAVIGVYSTVVLRHAFWRGANAMIALPLVLLGVGSSSVHFLARPHVFTFLFLAVAFWMIEADRRRPTRYLWLLVPLTVLWVNLHGGVFMFLACLGLLVLGSAGEAWLSRKSLDWRGWGAVRRYTVLLGSCAAASFVNPYGINLHRHVLSYLSSDWIRNNIQEFQAPTFRTEGQIQFELILILAVLVVTLLLRGRRITEALWLLFLAHSSLTSLRHAPLLCLVAVPLIAEELSSLWNRITLARNSVAGTLRTLGSDLSVGFQRTSVWIPVTLLIVAFLPLTWPGDFPKELFPTALVARNRKIFENGRILTSDQWGDYLIFHYYPRVKVYVDGRSDFYGEQLGTEYLHVLQLSKDWQKILDRRSFDTVLLGPEWPLVQMLKKSPDWRIAEETLKAILFVRRDRGAQAQNLGAPNAFGTTRSSTAGVQPQAQAPVVSECFKSPLVAAQDPSPRAALVLKKIRPEPNENLQHRRVYIQEIAVNERG